MAKEGFWVREIDLTPWHGDRADQFYGFEMMLFDYPVYIRSYLLADASKEEAMAEFKRAFAERVASTIRQSYF